MGMDLEFMMEYNQLDLIERTRLQLALAGNWPLSLKGIYHFENKHY